jgi:pyridoxal 5'-phosphate synthase pdxS subunit
MKKIQNMSSDELYQEAKFLQAPLYLIEDVRRTGRLPVVNFAAGGIATPADAALMMQLGADGNFVGSGIFKSADPLTMAKAIVQATAHYDDPKILLEASRGLSEAMKGIDIRDLEEKQKLQVRGV